MAGAGRLEALAASVLERAAPRLPPGPKLVAFSGGPDSSVCAWAASASGVGPVRAVFVDHGLPASAQMARAASAVVEALGMPLAVLDAPVSDGGSQEARLREARYLALEAEAEDGEWLLTGHTADDQAETVLGNVLRGSGAQGLAGIPAVRGRWRRPLLDVTRVETRELAALLGLPFADDPANTEPGARRNLLRHELIPDLERRFNPALRQALVRTGRLLAADDAALEAAAEAVPISLEPDGVVRLPAALLAVTEEPVASRAVRRALRALLDPYPGAMRDVEAVLAVARGDRPRSSLSGGQLVSREGAWVTLHGEPPAPPDPVRLDVPGEVRFGPWRIEGWIEPQPPSPWPLGRLAVILDAARVGEAATIRSVQTGDRIALPRGTKPAFEALSEAVVPVRLRDRWPVLEAHGKMAWLVGVRSAAWAWPTPQTTRYLWLKAKPERS
ncbi:MAG: tRNA lysidine(34) synthetase TilS [Acidimicrobiia bacterium]